MCGLCGKGVGADAAGHSARSGPGWMQANERRQLPAFVNSSTGSNHSARSWSYARTNQTGHTPTTMKKLLMIAALSLLTAAGALAQDKADQKEHKTPAERAKVQTARLQKELGLDATQASKVEAVNLKYAQQADQLRAEREAQMDKTKGEGKAMKEAHEAEMKGILTADQFAKYKTYHDERMEKMKEKRRASRADSKH